MGIFLVLRNRATPLVGQTSLLHNEYWGFLLSEKGSGVEADKPPHFFRGCE
jgi:hypothetical protein